MKLGLDGPLGLASSQQLGEHCGPWRQCPFHPPSPQPPKQVQQERFQMIVASLRSACWTATAPSNGGRLGGSLTPVLCRVCVFKLSDGGKLQ